MELVLGLAALATAVSGMAGAGQYDNAPEISETEPTTVQTTETIHQQEIQGTYQLPESHIGDLSESQFGQIDGILPRKKPHPLSNPETENNNTYKQANDMGALMGWYNNWSFTNHPSNDAPSISYTTMNGTIASTTDEDWFTFTLFGKADVNIQLSGIADNCDYNIVLYKKSNRPLAGDNDLVEVASSKRRGTFDEIIKKRVYPGVYYVKVYAAEGYGATKYYLFSSATYDREDACIEDMMDCGAKGALWLADYDPFGLKPTSKLGSTTVGLTYSQNVDHSKDYDYYHPEFPFATNTPYKQAEFFVWDLGLRSSLDNFVCEMMDVAEDYHTDAVNLSIQTQQAQSGSNIGINIFGTAAGCANPYFSWMFCAFGVCGEIANMLFPQGNIFRKYTDIIDYLGDLHAALECDAYTSPQEVVRIPVRYALSSSSTNGLIYPNKQKIGRPIDSYTLSSVSLSYDPICRTWDHLYDDDGKVPGQKRYIHAVDHEGQSPFVGTIFPILNAGNIDSAINQRIATALPTVTDLSLDQEDPVDLWFDEFKWYSFTAPLSGTNTYRFESIGNGGATCDVMDAVVYGNCDNHKIDYICRTDGIVNGDFAYEFDLEENETILFRVHGQVFDYTEGHGWNYELVDSCFVRVVLPRESSLVVNGYQLGVGEEYTDSVYQTEFMRRNNITISKLGCKLSDEGKVMMHVDMDSDYPVTYFKIDFHRYVKTFSFDAYKDPMRNECCLFLETQDLDGDPMYYEEIYGVDTDLENTKTFSFDFEHEHTSSITLRFDPANDPISYWQRKETIYFDHFVVEFMD